MSEPSGWTDFLDRVEERMRLLQRNALRAPGTPGVDAGPEFDLHEPPTVAPTEAERIRLATLLHAHNHAVERVVARRAELTRARHYHVSSAAR
jgi:hypothetical protein